MENYLPAAPGFYVLDIEIINDGKYFIKYFINYLPVTAWQLRSHDEFGGVDTKPISIFGVPKGYPAILSPNGRVNLPPYSFKDIDEWTNFEIDIHTGRSGEKQQDLGEAA